MFVKKWCLEYQKVIKTYFHIYLRDTSYSSDSSDSTDSTDSRDSSDSSVSCDSSDGNYSSDSSDQATLYTKTSRESQNAALRTSHRLTNVSNCSFQKNWKSKFIKIC